MIRNERGMTLIELLATTVILTIVLGIAFMVLQSLLQTSDDADEHQTHRMEISETLHHLSQELAQATAVYHPNENELRFESAGSEKGAYQAIVYDNYSLAVYRFNGDDMQFKDPAITFDSHPSLYESFRLLSDSLDSAPLYRSQEQTFTTLENGAFFTIELTFSIPAGPTNAIRQEVHELGIKLFDEGN